LKFDEEMDIAIHNRLKFEMGFDCDLKFIKKFTYTVQLENNLIENEIDYIYFGVSNANPIINQNEVSEYKWLSMYDLKNAMEKEPSLFTYWLKNIFSNFL
jgi:isopentenyl-diphosphate delta-isomerase